MKSFCLLLLASVASAAYNELKVEDCGGDGSVVVTKVDVNPMPIHMPGKLNVQLNAALKRDLQGPIGITVRMYTKTWFGWIKFPLCISHVGSCDYMDICERLDKLREKGCPKEDLAKLGINIPRCECPLPAAEVELAFKDIELPEIPAAFSMFAAGDYKIEGRLYEKGEEVVCFRVFASLA